MNVVLDIPDGLGQALVATPDSLRRRVALDLAVYYYAEQLVSIGKAAELSGLTRGEFETVLANRRVERNYSVDDLESDLRWAKLA